MTESFFTEDTVALKADPSITAVVQSTWRDVDSGGFSRSEDLIPHDGVSRDLVLRCLREAQVPPGHVVIKFIYPDFGATITHESALILKDRTLVVGDVVKRKSSDAESGMVIKTSTSCTLEPIYNDLPYHGSEPWEHLPQDNLLQVPTEDVQFIDYEPGDRIIYQNWMGEIEDVFEEVSVRLGNGTVVKVHDPDALEIPECVHREVFTNPPPLITALRIGRQRRGGIVSTSNKDETTGPPSSLYPGQSVLTTKANLRLGHWLIGSYTPSEPPRGIVVDVKVSSIKVVWVATKLYEMPSRDFMLPPEVLEFPELDEVRLYNKYNLTSTAENTSNQFGSRHGHDVSVGDVVKFRDVAGAAVKYSEQSLNRDQTGVFRRIPRIATQGFDMNTFRIANTDTHARIQWQSGQITKEDSNKVVPYINVDDHDVWIGEIVSLKSAEEKRGGLVYLKEIGVVQSVDADERIAKVRWFDNLVVSIFEDRPSTLVSEVSAGQISNRESSVALFDIAAYPALTKRRGDLVVLAPNDSLLGAAGMEFPTDVAQAMQMGHSLPLPFGPTGRLVHDPQNILSNALVRWFGEVVDLGLDGQLTVRLGALDRPEDIKVSIQRVAVAVSSDDYDSESDAASEDYFTESMSGDDEQLPISETIEYPDGQQMDSGAEEDWVTDEEDHDDPKRNDLKDKEPCVDRDGDVEMKDSTVGPEPADSAQKADNAQSDGAEPISNVAQGANEFLKQPSTQYRFAQLSNTPLQFEILEGDAPSSHHYASSETRFSSTFLRRVRKEHAMLENNLPDGIWIRTWDERLDLLRVLILGPQGTPYQSAPFLLDFKLEHDFPTSPPKVYFHSWTYDGTVCLSILGTWEHNSAHEGWNAAKSSLLQVIVSLLGLVLVEDPYYNEAGFESLVGSDETIVPARIYKEKALCMAKGFISYALSNDIATFDSILSWLYIDKNGPSILKDVVAHAKELMSRRQIAQGAHAPGQEPLSIGAEMLLKRYLPSLEGKLAEVNIVP